LWCKKLIAYRPFEVAREQTLTGNCILCQIRLHRKCRLRDISTFASVEVSREQIVMGLRVDEEKNIAYIKIKGKVSSEDILEAFDVAVSSEKYRKGMGRLWDFTDIDIASLDSSVIPEMAQLCCHRNICVWLNSHVSNVLRYICENTSHGF
jgi:hypothetical protein